MGSGDHLQDNRLLWLHETFCVQNQGDLEEKKKQTAHRSAIQDGQKDFDVIENTLPAHTHLSHPSSAVHRLALQLCLLQSYPCCAHKTAVSWGIAALSS